MPRGLSLEKTVIVSLVVVIVVMGAVLGYVYFSRQPLQTPVVYTATFRTPYTTVYTVTVTTGIPSIYPPPPPGEVRVRISTTTSLYATGLLDYLASEFNKIYPSVKIDFIAVGTGAALKIAERGDACAVLVHAPDLERQYIETGVIEYGRIFAYNYFIIVGPSDDPAGVRNSSTAVEAFRKIYAAGEAGKAVFVSRGDMSGTHVKELSIWREAGLNPRGRPWYREAGAGMDQVLVMSNELRAYTLSDIGTYLKFKKEGRLPNIEQLFASGRDLINIYSGYLVRGCPSDIRPYAKAFLDFIYYNQDLIGRYGVAEYGAPLFYPASGREKELSCIWLEIAGRRS